jgi:hypothetical protein
MCRRIHALDEVLCPLRLSSPVPEYMWRSVRDDPVAGPPRDDTCQLDGLEDELWANLGVHCRAGPAK